MTDTILISIYHRRAIKEAEIPKTSLVGGWSPSEEAFSSLLYSSPGILGAPGLPTAPGLPGAPGLLG